MDNSRKRSTENWHDRFVLQAQWTKQARQFLISELELNESQNILDIGCGTGVITDATQKQLTGTIFGLDISPQFLHKGRQEYADIPFTCGDAYQLPFPSNKFDACVSHFLLLWLTNPNAALKEMLRVTKKDGHVILFAEPDYENRIDYPHELTLLGELQEESLKQQGANPNIGRKLAHLLISAGCFQVNAGLLGGHWGKQNDPTHIKSEWETIRSDLSGLIDQETLENLLIKDLKAWQKGERILFVPTFYAWGRVGI